MSDQWQTVTFDFRGPVFSRDDFEAAVQALSQRLGTSVRVDGLTVTPRPVVSTPPHRRLRLMLNLEADNLDELAGALRMTASDIDIYDRETLEIASSGYSSGYHLTLLCDPEMDGDTYRKRLLEMTDERT